MSERFVQQSIFHLVFGRRRYLKCQIHRRLDTGGGGGLLSDTGGSS